MSDPSLTEFYSRIDKIEKARAKGYGFEAEGTLGRSHYQQGGRRLRLRLPFVRPVIALFICVTIVKALFLNQLGDAAYGERVSKLMAGEGIDRIGGFVMQADPVTRAVAHQAALLLRKFAEADSTLG